MRAALRATANLDLICRRAQGEATSGEGVGIVDDFQLYFDYRDEKFSIRLIKTQIRQGRWQGSTTKVSAWAGGNRGAWNKMETGTYGIAECLGIQVAFWMRYVLVAGVSDGFRRQGCACFFLGQGRLITAVMVWTVRLGRARNLSVGSIKIASGAEIAMARWRRCGNQAREVEMKSRAGGEAGEAGSQRGAECRTFRGDTPPRTTSDMV